MENAKAAEPETPTKAEPYAVCRYCGRELGRSEQIFFWRREEKAACLPCYDSRYLEAPIADTIGGVA